MMAEGAELADRAPAGREAKPPAVRGAAASEPDSKHGRRGDRARRRAHRSGRAERGDADQLLKPSATIRATQLY